MRPEQTSTTHAADAEPPEGGYPPEVTALISAVRTDLDAFSLQEQQVLERQGYLVADAQIRAHGRALVTRDQRAHAPYPEIAHLAVASAALAGVGQAQAAGPLLRSPRWLHVPCEA